MPTFRIETEQGTFDVEAPDEQTAIGALSQQLQAPEDREARAQALETEAAEREKRGLKAEVLAAPAAVAQGALNVAAGFGTGITEVGQAIADFAGMDSAAEFFGKREEAIKSGAAQATVDLAEGVMGRPLAPKEQQDFVDLSAGTIGRSEMAARIGGALAGGAATFGAKTLAGGVTLGSLEGALTGALFSNTDKATIAERRADRTKDVILGGALGGAFGTIPAILAGGKNFVANQIAKWSTNAEEGFRLADEFGVPVTLGQASGNPIVQELERQAAGEGAQTFLREQAEGLAQSVGARIGVPVRALDDVGEGLAQTVQTATNRVQGVVNAQKAARNTAWRDTLKQADTVSGGEGLYRPFDLLDELRSVTDDIVESTGGKLGVADPLKTLVKEVDQAVRGSGATAKNISSWLTRLEDFKRTGSGLLRGTSDEIGQDVAQGIYKGQAQVYAGRLSSRLNQSINSMQDAVAGTPLGDGITLVKQARANYAQASDAIRTIQSDFLGALGMNGTPAQILNRLGNSDPAVVRNVMNLVEGMDGGAVFKQTLQDAMLEQAVVAGTQGAVQKGFATGAMDVRSFVDAFAQTSRRSVLSGITTPAQERVARRAIDLSRRILNEPAAAAATGVIKTTLPVNVQDVAINVLSRDPGFMARLVAGAVSRGKGAEWLFFNPQGIEALQSMRDIAVRTPRVAATRNSSIIGLATAMGLEDRTNEEVGGPQQ